MKCQRAQQKFSQYLDSALEPGEQADLDAHLVECAKCRRELQAWQRTVAALRSLPRHSAPAGFGRRLMERFESVIPDAVAEHFGR